MKTPVRTLLVDPSPAERRSIRAALSGERDIVLVGAVGGVISAISFVRKFRPDVLLLDPDLDEGDGLDMLDAAVSVHPARSVILSSAPLDERRRRRAVDLGAVGFVAKPSSVAPDLRASAYAKLAASVVAAGRSPARVGPGRAPVLRASPECCSIIAVGSSTGGPAALRRLLQGLPEDAPPVVIAQHIRDGFGGTLASVLSAAGHIPVQPAEPGRRPERGKAYLAPDGAHTKVLRDGGGFVFARSDGPKVNLCRPSVDILFNSVADAAGPEAIGIILTGMGSDGAADLLKMRMAGAHTIGQNEASSTVYGMARSASEIGAVEVELPLDEIALHVGRRLGLGHSPGMGFG